MNGLLSVDIPPLNFGLVVQDDTVIRTPPCARYTHGWSVWKAATYFEKRGAVTHWIPH